MINFTAIVLSGVSLITAIIEIESGNNPNAYNKIENAVGVLQIRPIMVREVNRVLKLQRNPIRYTLSDRWNREKSIEMFKVIRNYHFKDASNEKIARCWNGGLRGYLKKSTEKYWAKIKLKLK
jgi:uncharacterized protein with PIN domain